MQQVCASPAGTVAVSDWSVGSTFSTALCPVNCPTPTNLLSTNTSATGTVLYIGTTANAGIYNIRYHGANSTAWITLNNITTPFQLGNLSCGTTYEWQAQQVCTIPPNTTPILSPWSTGATFTTSICPSNCLTPIGLSTTNINMTSAMLSWGAVPGSIYYIVRYKKASNTDIFNTVTSTTNSLQLIGLNAATTYIWQVEAVCSTVSGTTAVSTSRWSTTAVFTTPSLTVYPNPANRLMNVTCWSDQVTEISIELRDSFGKLVYYDKPMTVVGTNNFNFETSGFTEGLYFLNIQNSYGTVTTKVIIQH